MYNRGKHFGLLTEIPAWLAAQSNIGVNQFLVPEHQPELLLVNDGSYRALDNICTHKQALLSEGQGALKQVIVCPIHKWTWATNGCIRGARGFQTDPTMNLRSHPITLWQGHMFTGSTHWLDNIAGLGDLSAYLDISKYQFHSRTRIEYQFSWQIFMEIFLDLYHVKSFHPGLRSLTDCDKFEWVFGEHWACQTGGFKKEWPTESNYQALYKLYQSLGYYDTAQYGAVWLGIYPNIMIEYYPGCIVVSTIWPNGPGKSINHLEFYYESGLVERCPEFPGVQQRSFMVTADEDEQIGNAMQRGRSLYTGPRSSFNHPLEEAGYSQFYSWLDARTGN